MKLTTFILIIALAQVSAKGFGQRISLNETNTPLEKVLQSIKEQSGYVFFYDVNDLKDQKISVKLTNVSVEDAVKASLKDLPLSYKIVKNNVVLSKKDPTFLERLAERWASIDVSGRVVDAEGKALPGATVKVKATGKGVSTDGKGNFHLKNVEEGAVLVVSYTGYVSKEVSASVNMGSVVLEVSLSKLDEVQVIAYGTTTQRLSTGNVTTIKADVIEKQPVNNPLLALQGRVPGLFIEQQTGFAGTGIKVRIQGTNSIDNGNDPLYVIDGILYSSQLVAGSNPILGNSESTAGNPLNFINPSDIESISILKDADATAVYGSRAANGAILITTKKGKPGDLTIDINLQNGWGKVGRRMDLMDSKQYLQMREEAFKNDKINLNLPPYNTAIYKRVYYPDIAIWDTTRNTDWQKGLIGGVARYQDFQTSVSGGNTNTQFLLSAGYHKEGTVFPGNYADRKASVRFNINTTSLNQKFRVQFSGFYLNDDNLLPQGDLTQQAMTLAPDAPNLLNADGSLNWAPDPFGATTFYSNPLISTFSKYSNKTDNLISNAILGYTILPGLEMKSNFAYTVLRTKIIRSFSTEAVAPEYQIYGASNNSTFFGNSEGTSWSIEPQIIYRKNINKGKLEALLGSTIQAENRGVNTLIGTGFSSGLLLEDIKSAASIIATDPSGNSLYKYGALFGKLNYNWRDKYIIDLTARRDGSSRFGAENKFHNFGAVGIAWIFSEQSLFRNYLQFLSFGKLRGSYGTTGNDKIPDYSFLSLYDAIGSGLVPYQGVKGYQVNRLTNPYLQWEETQKLQIGLDLGFFKDKILLNVNYSRNRSSNQLVGDILPIITGFSSITRNFPATIQNTGWEFMLSTVVLNKMQFHWSSSINLTLPKNKLVSYPGLDESAAFLIVGQSLNVQQLYRFNGVDPVTGIYSFLDHEGKITSSPDFERDRVVIMNPDPKFYGGFQNSISYKGLQLDVLLQFTKQQGQNYSLGSNSIPGTYAAGYGNQPVWLSDRWQQEGDQSSTQKYTTTRGLGVFNARYFASGSNINVGDASYVRLKNVSLYWQLLDSWKKATRLKSCRLYLQGQNLLTITHYKGLDPESKSTLSLPPLRVITFGIQVGI